MNELQLSEGNNFARDALLVRQAFGRAADRLRIQRSMTVAQLARAAHCNRTYLTSILDGRHDPGLRVIVGLRRALHVPWRRLWKEMERELFDLKQDFCAGKESIT